MAFPASGTYRIERLLGKGSWGRVFLATHPSSQTPFALKFLDSKNVLSLRFLEQEAAILSQLAHPNLVRIFEYDPSGPFVALEYLEGKPLDQSDRIEAVEAVDLLGQIGQGLHYLHQRKILHRDLKPSNVFRCAEGGIKLLDFGLAGSPSKETRGTLAYLPPEAFLGEYEARSDLFSAGLLLYEILAGHPAYPGPMSGALSAIPKPDPLGASRPDLPEFLVDAIMRLIEPPPARRFGSAAALLRFLNRHLDKPLPMLGEAAMELAVQKLPLIGRENSMKAFRRNWEAADSDSPLLVGLRGPAGVGRSRFLEELGWSLRLEGIAVCTLPPEDSKGWAKALAERLGLATDQAGIEAWLPSAADLKRRAAGGFVLAFPDFHRWASADAQALLYFLGLLGTAVGRLALILEYDEDMATPGLRERLKNFEPTLRYLDLPLADLSQQDSALLLREADFDRSISNAEIQKRAKAAGGRPALLLAGLRDRQAAPPRNLAEAAERRVRALSPPARELLALIATHPEDLDPGDASAMLPDPEKLSECLGELVLSGFLHPRSPERSTLGLAHPSLRPCYLAALSETERLQAHRKWIGRLQEAGEPWPLAEHAFGAGENTLALRKGLAAAESWEAQGRRDLAAEWYRRLLPLAETAADRVLLQAHIAHLSYLEGRYEEALAAYDLWIAERADDESRLQRVKHRFYTGLVLHAAGSPEAEARLRECLAAGDAELYPALRPYQARAHSLLAAIVDRRDSSDAALPHLEAAIRLSQEDPLLLAEMERRRGDFRLERLEYPAAISCFENSLELSRRAGHRQAEAIALHSLGMARRDQGRLHDALDSVRRAVTAAREAGDVLQWCRYRENEALLELESGSHVEAHRDLADSGSALQALGNAEDRTLARLHAIAADLAWGHFSRARKALEREAPSPVRSYLEGELAYLLGDFEAAAKSFGDATDLEAKSILGVLGAIGQARCRFRQGGMGEWTQLRSRLAEIDGPIFRLWERSLAFLGSRPSDRSQEDFFALLEELRSCERTETRLDLFGILAAECRRSGLWGLADRLAAAEMGEWLRLKESLPEELKMDFEKNRKLEDLLPEKPATAQATAVPPPIVGISEDRFRQFSEINRQIAQKKELSAVLERVMDAAIELSGAERGFLVIKDEAAKAPFKGYRIAAARGLQQRALGGKELQFSSTAVRQVAEQGSYLLTDNAQLDSRLQQKSSVVQYQLKSILAVPLEIEGEVEGVIYLDHRYRLDCFAAQDLQLIMAFAAQAALAIDKARMLEDLGRAQRELRSQVESQSQRIEMLSAELAGAREELKYEYRDIVGKSPAMMRVFQMLDHVIETSIPVWIFGESGTGKELIARSLHYNSPRKARPFVTENVSAIPETLLESELFGHKRGAFTHADRDRVGLFEQADGGTLFLDEVADMSLGMQAKLLRVLQEGEVRPLGSPKKVKVDVRLVTASNRDLAQMVKEEKFRQDLFFRINGMTVKLPPLRERREDIPLLAAHLVKKISRDFHLQASEICDEAYQQMLRHSWPGNIRELENVLRNALLFAKGRPIQAEHLMLASAGPLASPALETASEAAKEERGAERELILETLRRHRMDKEAVAQELGISLRTLYTRMERLRIPKKKTVLAKALGLATT